MMKNLTKQVADLEAKWKRAVADYRNLERRVNDQQRAVVKFANALLIEKLLAVGDDLERANEHLQDGGLKLIIDRFKDILKSEGVDMIETQDKEFDPHLMECTETVAGAKNRVVKVIRAGYTLNGKVLRPAQVAVGGKV
jgi:molecular chaperone GrpE